MKQTVKTTLLLILVSIGIQAAPPTVIAFPEFNEKGKSLVFTCSDPDGNLDFPKTLIKIWNGDRDITEKAMIALINLGWLEVAQPDENTYEIRFLNYDALATACDRIKVSVRDESGGFDDATWNF